MKTIEIQQALKQKGFDPGPLDGAMGPLTRQAIEAFEAAHGLKADGAPDSAFLKALTGGEAATPWLPWLAEAERRKGLHESRDKARACGLPEKRRRHGRRSDEASLVRRLRRDLHRAVASRRAAAGQSVSRAQLAEVRRRLRTDARRGARLLARIEGGDLGTCRVLRRAKTGRPSTCSAATRRTPSASRASPRRGFSARAGRRPPRRRRQEHRSLRRAPAARSPPTKNEPPRARRRKEAKRCSPRSTRR